MKDKGTLPRQKRIVTILVIPLLASAAIALNVARRDTLQSADKATVSNNSKSKEATVKFRAADPFIAAQGERPIRSVAERHRRWRRYKFSRQFQGGWDCR